MNVILQFNIIDQTNGEITTIEKQLFKKETLLIPPEQNTFLHLSKKVTFHIDTIIQNLPLKQIYLVCNKTHSAYTDRYETFIELLNKEGWLELDGFLKKVKV